MVQNVVQEWDYQSGIVVDSATAMLFIGRKSFRGGSTPPFEEFKEGAMRGIDKM